nr:uncharacterized protein LOC128691436 [Cherax quadricarinatus]
MSVSGSSPPGTVSMSEPPPPTILSVSEPPPSATVLRHQPTVNARDHQPTVSTPDCQIIVSTIDRLTTVGTIHHQTTANILDPQTTVNILDPQTTVNILDPQATVSPSDYQRPVTTSDSQKLVRLQLSVPYNQGDRCGFRLQKMIRRTARDVLHQVYEWGTQELAINVPLHEYLQHERKLRKKQINQIFNKSMLDTLTADPSGVTYDISLLYKCIQMVCQHLAPANNSAWWTPASTLEFTITSIKNFRNDQVHIQVPLTQAEFINKTEELRELLRAALETAGEKYNIDLGTVEQCVFKMDQSISLLRNEPFQQWNITSVENELLFKEGLELLMSVGLQELKENYTKWSHINPMSFLDETEFHPQVNTMFTQMEIVLEKRCVRSQAIKNKDLLQYVADSTSNNITMLEGVAGAGKTTLTKMIMSDWITGSSSIDKLTNFNLLLYMECRNPVVQSLSQLLSTLMPKTARKFRENDIVKCVLQFKTIVIVDGLDELNISSTKLLKEILSIKSSYDIAIFCTTRPEKVNDFFKMVPAGLTTTYLKIIGIQDSMRERFVELYHEEMKKVGMSTQETSGLITYMRKTQNQLQEHLRLPLNLVLLTFLWAVGGDKVNIVTTATELYSEIHTLMLEKLLERLKAHSLTELLETSQLRSKIHIFLSSLYRESLVSLKNENIVLTDESMKNLKDVCSKIGLPQKEMMSAYLSQKTLWTMSGIQMRLIIPHKGLQDFYGAMYLLEKCTNTLEESGFLGKMVRIIVAPFKTSSIVKGLKQIHKTDTDPLQLEKYQNVLIHLTGLLHIRAENVPMNVTNELVTLLRESGIRNRDEWLDMLSSVKCNPNMIKILVKQIPNFLMEDGRVEVEDSRVDCYTNLLPRMTPKEVIVKIKRKPQDIPRLEALLELLSLQAQQTCQYQVELHLEYLFRHPGALHSSLDSILQRIFQKCSVRRYRGGFSPGLCSVLSHTLKELSISIATPEDGPLLAAALNTPSSLLPRLPSLNKLCVHVGQEVEASMLVPLPPLRYLEVYLSHVTRQRVPWAVEVARSLQPVARGFSCMRLASCDLSVESCQQLMQQLTATGVTVWGGFYVSSTNIPQVEEAQLRDFTDDLMGCVFWRMDKENIWVY